MPYRLKRNETVADGLRRIANEEAGKALAAATVSDRPAAEAIHQARTACKKLRGLLRLARPHLAEVYRRENDFVGDAARTLSAARDAAVMRKTFDDVARGSELDAASIATIRQRLSERVVSESETAGDAQRLAAFAETLRDLPARIEAWTIDADGFAAVGPGMTEIYRRGRRAMRAAFKQGHAEDFHEWRKDTKYHWYHVRLLRNVWMPLMTARSSELDALSELLGDEHDLAVLQDAAAALSDVDSRAIETLLSRIDARRSALQRDARPLGERLFAEKPAAFERRMRRYWKTWHTA